MHELMEQSLYIKIFIHFVVIYCFWPTITFLLFSNWLRVDIFREHIFWNIRHVFSIPFCSQLLSISKTRFYRLKAPQKWYQNNGLVYFIENQFWEKEILRLHPYKNCFAFINIKKGFSNDPFSGHTVFYDSNHRIIWHN